MIQFIILWIAGSTKLIFRHNFAKKVNFEECRAGKNFIRNDINLKHIYVQVFCELKKPE